MKARPIQSEQMLRRRRLHLALNILLAVTGGLAIAVLVIEYGGFRDLPRWFRTTLLVVQAAVVAVFVLDRILRLLLAERRLHHIRENWADVALIVVLLVAMGIVARMRGQLLSAGALYVAITQIYILITLILRGVNIHLHLAGSGIPPTWLLIGSFAMLCLVGSGLLMLPAATPEDSRIIYYPDALFTAVSATCVTGLIVRDTGAEYTLFGQMVILGMIQLGGLGIMLFGTVLAMWVGKGLSMRGSDAIGQMMGTEGIGRLGRAVRFVVVVTLAIELLGAVLLYPMFAETLDTHGRAMASGDAVWHSVFHSVSSFCNAGFALYGNNMMQGVREG